MSADWIKMRTDLYRDPKVCVIADALLASDGELARYVSQMNQRDMSVTRNVTRNATVGALVTVWGVMRHRGKRVDVDLVCRGVSLWIVDDVADMPGFGAALASVGWVIETSEGIVFPSFFDEYNVDPSEKKAASSADRQRRYRESKKQKSGVTRDVTRDVTVTHREEKSREEKEKGKPRAGKAKSVTLAGWIDALEGGDAVPADDPIFDWAGKVGLPREWIALAWWAFEGRYTGDGQGAAKTYTDWRATFRNAVREDWLKLWRAGPDGYVLTTAGKQAQMEMRA